MGNWGIFWGFVIAFAFFDGTRDWSKGDGLKHTLRAFVRVAFIVLLSFQDFGFDAYETVGAFKLACYRFCWFWVVFDLLVNIIHFRREVFIFRELRWVMYLGNTSFLDWIFRAAWGVGTFQDLKKPNYRLNTIGATATQYFFKLGLLAITYYLSNFTSDLHF